MGTDIHVRGLHIRSSPQPAALASDADDKTEFCQYNKELRQIARPYSVHCNQLHSTSLDVDSIPNIVSIGHVTSPTKQVQVTDDSHDTKRIT